MSTRKSSDEVKLPLITDDLDEDLDFEYRPKPKNIGEQTKPDPFAELRKLREALKRNVNMED